MLKKVGFLRVFTGLVFAGLGLVGGDVQAQSVSFVCSTDSANVPTTYAKTPSGAVEVFKWSSNYFSAPYTPMQRCIEVTKRLNTSKPTQLSSGKVNSYNVICFGSKCEANGSNILLTLKPNQDPKQVLYEIDQNREGAAGPSKQLGNDPVTSNTTETNVTDNGDGSVTLDLSGYIDRAPKIPKNLENNSLPDETSPVSNPQNPTPEAPVNNTSTSKPGKVW